MFGDFLTDLGEETSALALITSSFFSALSFAGKKNHNKLINDQDNVKEKTKKGAF